MRSSSHCGSTSLKNRDVTDFLFRGLMFEAEAEAFRRAGIQIGADSTDAEESLLKEALAPFGIVRRNKALEMARLFAGYSVLRMKSVILSERRLKKRKGSIG